MATLLVAGERDTKFTTLAYTMAAAIGDRATVVLMPGAGHAVPFEEPTRFVTAIEQWIDHTS
jgi:pimeloyl-ACP methyl ester carboxylesterase